MRARLRDSISLGNGHRATFMWESDDPRPAIPAGIIEQHARCRLCVPWAAPEGFPHPVFTLVSLVPLTIAESLECRSCGTVGRIQGGLWISEEGA